MNKNLKIVIAVVGFAAFLLVVWLIYTNLSAKYQGKEQWTREPATESPGVQTSENPKVEAPDFTVIDANGNEVKLSDYKGTPVVLNFWTSWCPSCVSEMPEFNKVAQEYTSDKLVFLMVDLADGKRETVETAKKFLEDNKYTINAVFDTKGEASVAYDVQTIPRTFFIDKDGYAVAAVYNAIDEKTLRKGIAMIYSP